MKKLLPSLLIIAGFSSMLACMVGFDIVQSKVVFRDLGQQVDHNFDYLFSEVKMKSISKEGYFLLRELNAPVVILNFWASWCSPCLEEFSSMSHLLQKYNSDQVAIVGVNSDNSDTIPVIRKTRDKYLLNKMIFVSDQDGELASHFKVFRIPYTVVFIKGHVEVIKNGYFNFDSKKLANLIDKALE